MADSTQVEIEMNESNDDNDDNDNNDNNGSEAAQTAQISVRIRKMLPWEDPIDCIEVEDNALGIVRNHSTLKGEEIVNFYQFHHLFRSIDTNKSIFDQLCVPLCKNTIEKGYNSIFIAYGQTGTGKTYTMLGKPHEKIVGVLPMCVQWFLNHQDTNTVFISAVEVYGISTQRIDVFDLLIESNTANQKWSAKESLSKTKTNIHEEMKKIQVSSEDEAYQIISKAQLASHFAPTGKNPESSRGHIVFIVSVTSKQDITSNFVCVDLAGSEGMSALTPAFRKRVSSKVLKTRQLEAGIINYGLSQLQKVLQEINKRNENASTFKENGLRRVLFPYVSKHTFISVLFTISPSQTNIESTRSTMRVANFVSMIKIIPRKMERAPTPQEIIQQLQKTINQQRSYISILEQRLETAETSTLQQDAELKSKRSELDKLTSQMKDLKATESALTDYAKSLENDLQKMQNEESEQRRETQEKLNNVESELRELRDKELQLQEIDAAIEQAITTNGDNTAFDDENLEQADKESAKILENSDINTQIMSDDDFDAANVQTADKFRKLIEDKEKNMLELKENLTKEKEKAIAELQESKQHLKRMTIISSQHEERVKLLAEELKQQNQHKDKLHTDLKSHESKQNELESELKQTKDALFQETAKSDKKIEELNSEIEKLKKQNEELQSKGCCIVQ